ncbi:MAG: hemerythrin domain-containing protein, partial [bacterium]
KADHQRIADLVERLKRTQKADAITRTKLVDDLRNTLLAHSRSETDNLYTRLLGVPSSKAHIADLIDREFFSFSTEVSTLAAIDPTSDKWDPSFAALAAHIASHIANVDDELLPAATGLFTTEEAEAAGTKMVEWVHKNKMRVESDGFPTLQDPVTSPLEDVVAKRS